MEKENEIQKIENRTPNQMIQLAIEGKADLEKLEKLLGLQEKYEKNEARKVFASDFATVQAEIVAVVKTKSNPQTHSKYAGLDNVLEISKPVYTKHGFSVIFYEGKTEATESIRVCADVLHKSGHKETYHFDVPLDGVGIKGNVNMTKIHGKASSVSYGRRYLLCMIWNIPTQDDDGQAAGEPKRTTPAIPNKQESAVLKTICNLLTVRLNKKILEDKVAAIFYVGQNNHYPSKPDKVEVAIKWLIGLNREPEWAAEDIDPDDPFPYHCNACGIDFGPEDADDDCKQCKKCLSTDVIRNAQRI